MINKQLVPFQLFRFTLLWEYITQSCIRCKRLWSTEGIILFMVSIKVL